MNLQFKIILLAAGISQAELARAIGRSRATVTNWMQGHSRPSAEDQRRVSEVLGRSPRQIFGEGVLIFDPPAIRLKSSAPMEESTRWKR